jgi:hypothetical protein
MKNKFLFLLLLITVPFASKGQSDVIKIIQQKDSLFWVAYNTCDIDNARAYFTEDVEFYHDKGGLTFGRDSLISSLKINLCSNSAYKLRREAVDGTVRFFPLKNGDSIYGVVISGEHIFYIAEKGAPEKLDGLANFVHLWLLKNGNWEMARILSFDHRPAPYVNKRKQIQLSNQVLDQYPGPYKGANSGSIQVVRSDQSLILSVGDGRYVLYPEKDDTFFVKDRDLTFEFKKNEKNKVAKLIIWEHGKVAEEAISVR